MQAVVVGNPEIVHILLEKGADVQLENNYGRTAYDMAKNTNDLVRELYFLDSWFIFYGVLGDAKASTALAQQERNTSGSFAETEKTQPSGGH